MNENERSKRHDQIRSVAFDLLREVGYRRTSMLLIARRAQASNQTLYAWYGNKQQLFRGIIEQSGRAVREHLERSLRERADPLQALAELGPTLLRFTTDADAITMNRAAVIDAAETGVLAEAIDEVGRGILYPLIRALMTRLVEERVFAATVDAEEAAQTYVALLFGEAQLRQALGTLPPCDAPEIARRSARAFELTCRLYLATNRKPKGTPQSGRQRAGARRLPPKGARESAR